MESWCSYRIRTVCKHVQSDHHTEAHSALYILPTQTKDIDELLDIGHASKKLGNRNILLTTCILQNVRFLAKQGLPLREDRMEDNSNFMQTLLLRAENNAQLVNG